MVRWLWAGCEWEYVVLLLLLYQSIKCMFEYRKASLVTG